jgi:small subunit ribosomal protein S16
MVKIRLMRRGATKRPFYRVVVADSRSPRDGRFIENIGKYHPLEDPSLIEIDADRALHWLSNGAQPTEQVTVLLKVKGIWEQFEATKSRKPAKPKSAKAPKGEKRPKVAAAKGSAADATEASEEPVEASEPSEPAEASEEAGDVSEEASAAPTGRRAKRKASKKPS